MIEQLFVRVSVLAVICVRVAAVRDGSPGLNVGSGA
jgi:hypothetical protein